MLVPAAIVQVRTMPTPRWATTTQPGVGHRHNHRVDTALALLLARAAGCIPYLPCTWFSPRGLRVFRIQRDSCFARHVLLPGHGVYLVRSVFYFFDTR